MSTKKIKVGNQFRHNADDITILDRRGDLILAKIVGGFGTYYDISQPKIDSYGDELFWPSPNANGLQEIIAGGQKVPKSMETMTAIFNERAETIETSRRSKAEALATFNKRTDNRATRIGVVKEIKNAAVSELAAITNGDKPLNDVIISKRALQLASTITVCEQVLNVVR